MPRYFFDARSGASFTQDDDGMDLPDLEAARDAALRVAEQFWGELSPSIMPEVLTVEVLDDAGQELTTVHVAVADPPNTPHEESNSLRSARQPLV